MAKISLRRALCFAAAVGVLLAVCQHITYDPATFRQALESKLIWMAFGSLGLWLMLRLNGKPRAIPFFTATVLFCAGYSASVMAGWWWSPGYSRCEPLKRAEAVAIALDSALPAAFASFIGCVFVLLGHSRSKVSRGELLLAGSAVAAVLNVAMLAWLIGNTLGMHD